LSVTCGWTVVFSINKTDRHEITVILLKVALNTITLTQLNGILTCKMTSNNDFLLFISRDKRSDWLILMVPTCPSFKVIIYKYRSCVHIYLISWHGPVTLSKFIYNLYKSKQARGDHQNQPIRTLVACFSRVI
jgi:hypothetical protein